MTNGTPDADPTAAVLNDCENDPAEHWCHVVWLCGSFNGWETLAPPRLAASWHAPEGPSAVNAIGHVPRAHPPAAPRLPGATETLGPEVSAPSISISRTASSPGFVEPSQVLQPQTTCQPKYGELIAGEL